MTPGSNWKRWIERNRRREFTFGRHWSGCLIVGKPVRVGEASFTPGKPERTVVFSTNVSGEWHVQPARMPQVLADNPRRQARRPR